MKRRIEINRTEIEYPRSIKESSAILILPDLKKDKLSRATMQPSHKTAGGSETSLQNALVMLSTTNRNLCAPSRSRCYNKQRYAASRVYYKNASRRKWLPLDRRRTEKEQSISQLMQQGQLGHATDISRILAGPSRLHRIHRE
jgi:hypothetical protein